MSKIDNYYYKASKSKLLRPILSNIFLAMGIHWFFQCILQMDRTERFFKLTVDAILTILFYLVFSHWLAFIPALVLGWGLAHTINFLFNAHIFSVIKCFGYVKHKEEEFDAYINSMKIRIREEPSLRWAAVYGSLSRGEMKITSDLDVRVIRYPGFYNGINACLFIMGERTRAHIKRFPLDILLLDNSRLLGSLRPDETPLVIYDAVVSLSRSQDDPSIQG